MSGYSLMRSAAVVLIVFLLAVEAASAKGPEKGWQIWCLSPTNRANVVSVAQQDGYGTAQGIDSALIRPTGSEKALTLEEWEASHPHEFKAACLAAFVAFGGVSVGDLHQATRQEVRAVTADTKAVNDSAAAAVTWPVEVGIAIGGALLGFLGGFLVTQWVHNEERRQAEDDALRDELGALASNIDILKAKTRSGTAEPEDYVAARQLAFALCTRVKRFEIANDQASPTQTAVKSSIDSLEKFMNHLAERSQDREQVRQTIEQDFIQVETSVSALARKVGKASGKTLLGRLRIHRTRPATS
jgi:hypothetical protein